VRGETPRRVEALEGCRIVVDSIHAEAPGWEVFPATGKGNGNLDIYIYIIYVCNNTLDITVAFAAAGG
jgi:hypothetical protein